MVIGVDFDNTIVKSRYPNIGRTKFLAIPVLKWLSKRHTLVLWTCRSGRLRDDAVRWCMNNGIEFDFVNANTFDRIRQYGGDCRKLSCDMLIDDTAGVICWPWVWVKVRWLEWRRKI